MIPLLIAVLLFAAPLEQQALDTAAALQSNLSVVKAKYGESCRSQPQPICTLLSRAILGRNTLTTAKQAYCGTSKICTPVKSAEDGLTAAIAKAKTLTEELKATH